MFFKSKSEIKIFADNQSLRGFSTNRTSLHELLEDLLQEKGKLVPEGKPQTHSEMISKETGENVGK